MWADTGVSSPGSLRSPPVIQNLRRPRFVRYTSLLAPTNTSHHGRVNFWKCCFLRLEIEKFIGILLIFVEMYTNQHFLSIYRLCYAYVVMITNQRRITYYLLRPYKYKSVPSLKVSFCSQHLVEKDLCRCFNVWH